jgi:hypothetical protein
MGESSLSMVRKAARLAVYEEIMIRVKNHQKLATVRVDTARGRKSQPCEVGTRDSDKISSFRCDVYKKTRCSKYGTVSSIFDLLKGQYHEIFDFCFFSWISFPQAPEYTIRVVSNFFENSRRYSQLKVCHRCRYSIIKVLII